MSIPPTPKPALVVDDWPLSPKTPFATSLRLVIPPVVAPSIIGSPVSDSDSDSSLSSTPSSLVGLKQPLPPLIEPAPASEDTPASPTAEPDEVVVDEVMDVPETLGEPTPDPPESTVALVHFLPGSFDPPTASTTLNVSLMKGDVFQLCRAMSAVTNCAGLVAQFVVGFSMWWSLVLAPV